MNPNPSGLGAIRLKAVLLWNFQEWSLFSCWWKQQFVKPVFCKHPPIRKYPAHISIKGSITDSCFTFYWMYSGGYNPVYWKWPWGSRLGHGPACFLRSIRMADHGKTGDNDCSKAEKASSMLSYHITDIQVLRQFQWHPECCVRMKNRGRRSTASHYRFPMPGLASTRVTAKSIPPERPRIAFENPFWKNNHGFPSKAHHECVQFYFLPEGELSFYLVCRSLQIIYPEILFKIIQFIQKHRRRVPQSWTLRQKAIPSGRPHDWHRSPGYHRFLHSAPALLFVSHADHNGGRCRNVNGWDLVQEPTVLP